MADDKPVHGEASVDEMVRMVEGLDQTDDPEEQQKLVMEGGKQPGVTFDMQIVELLRPALTECFQKHGDMLRSVGVFFDYYGSLNATPSIQKGMWLGPEGAVSTPDGVIGSLQGSLVLLEEILTRAAQMEAHARENLGVLLGEIQQRSEEHEQLKRQIAELRGELGDSGGGD